MNTTIDSGAFPVLGTHGNRKRPNPGDTLIGNLWPTARPGRPTTANLQLVHPSAQPRAERAPPPPSVSGQVVAYFQLGLAAMVLVSVFVL